MWKNLSFYLNKSRRTFKFYLKTYRDIAKSEYSSLENNDDSLVSIDKYFELRKFLICDAKFMGSLNLGERAVVRLIVSDGTPNKFGDNFFESAFEKWCHFFFDNGTIYKEIDKQVLGLVFSRFRKEKELTKKELASLIDVDVKTVSRIENGETMPSLEYAYRFSCICEISLDRIMECAEID